MTGAEALAEVRFLIREDTASFWTDAALYLCLTGSLRKFSLAATQSNHHQYLMSGTVTLSSGDSSLDLPDACNGHIHRISRSNGTVELPKTSCRIVPGSTGEPTEHRVVGNTVQFNREANTDYEYTLWYFYAPDAIDGDTTAIDFPAGHEYLLCFDAAIKALIRKKGDISPLQGERDRLELIYREMLRNRSHGSPNKINKGLRTRFNGY